MLNNQDIEVLGLLVENSQLDALDLSLMSGLPPFNISESLQKLMGYGYCAEPRLYRYSATTEGRTAFSMFSEDGEIDPLQLVYK